MVNQKFGSISWNDKSLDGAAGERSEEKGRFLRLKPGSNLVRVLTEPFQYFQHKYKFSEDTYARRIYCSIQHGSCVVCSKGDKPKKRWFLGVIDRSTGLYKVLDANWSIISDIKTNSNDEDWGPTINYDFDIVMNPNSKGPVGFYKAVAKPKKPLSAADLKVQEDVNLEYLERLCAPPDPSKVEERFQELMQEFLKGGAAGQAQAKLNQQVTFGKAPVSTTTDDDDFQDSDAVTKASSLPF